MFMSDWCGQKQSYVTIASLVKLKPAGPTLSVNLLTLSKSEIVSP